MRAETARNLVATLGGKCHVNSLHPSVGGHFGLVLKVKDWGAKLFKNPRSQIDDGHN